MKTNWVRLFQVIVILVFLFGSVNLKTVLAQDETPLPTDSISVIEVVTSEPASVTEVSATEVPATEVVPVVLTAIVTEPPADVESTDPNLVEVVEALDAANIVVADENGDPLPLASQQVEDAVASSDPFFWDSVTSTWVGYATTSTGCPIGVICNVSATPFQAAVSAAPANSTIYVSGAAATVGGTPTSDFFYNEDVVINTSGLSFIGFNTISSLGSGVLTISTPGYAIVKSIRLNANFGNSSGVYANQVNLTSVSYIQDAVDLLNATPIKFGLTANNCTSQQDFINGWCVDKKIEWCHCEPGNGQDKDKIECKTIEINRSGVNGHDGHIGHSNHVGEHAGPCAAPSIPPCSISGQVRTESGECVTPTPSATNTATATDEPTATATDEPTATATDEPPATATATDEPTATATDEPTATATDEPTATATDEPPATATATDEPTATATDEPTATATDEPPATATATDEPTATATDEPTATSTNEPTETPTVTSTPTETATPTPTATTVVTTVPPFIPVTGGTPAALVIPVTGGQLIPVTGGTLIVSGLGHSCMTYNNGQVICWGLNASGQVGDGTNKDQHKAVYVKDLEGVLNLTAGSKHTCALTISGEIWCWGENSSGQLGNGTTENSNIPVKVIDLPGKVLSITAGEEFTCAQMMNQEVWCWGKNDQGQLNDGTTKNQLNPVKSKLNTMLAQISGGQGLLLSSDVLGTVNKWSKVQAAAVQQIAGSLSISANRWGDTGCAVASDGSVKCWGSNLISAPVKDTLPALEVGAGLAHNCNINTDESVSCWGANANGQLGNGSTIDSLSATLVKNLTKAHALAVGANHTCILSGTSNIAWCWGENTYGQLGNDTTINNNVPVLVIMPAIQ